MIVHPTKTVAGRQATFNAANNGIDLTLTHVSIGDGGGAIDDTRTSLRRERERVSAYGKRISIDQIHLDALFDGDAEFWVKEVGIWSDQTLIYYWSTSGVELGYKSKNLEWMIGLDLAVDEATEANITVNPAPPNLLLTTAPQLSVILQSLCDTNRLILQNQYF